LVAIENADVIGQPPGKIGKHVAQRQQTDHRGEIFHRPRRANLNGKPPSRPFVGTDSGDHILHPQDSALVQHANRLFGLSPIVGEQGAVDILAQCFGFGRHEIATDPGPDRFERDARDTADALMFGASIDQELLERGEKQPRRVADPRYRLGIGADGAAQFLQHYFVAGTLSAAQQAALKLLDKHRTRRRLERPEIFPQLFDGLTIARHIRKTVALDLPLTF
ncbi:MAG: hypothetical protein WAM74_00370, partial [Xanthobacteraceae bacterium]